MTLSAATYAIVLIFMGLAAWEIGQADRDRRRILKWAAVAAGAMAAILLLSAAGILLGAARSNPWHQIGDLFFWALIVGVPAFVLFQGTLLREWRAGKRVAGRAFPLLDVYSSGVRAARLRDRAWNAPRAREFLVYLFLIMGFIAAWLHIAAQFFHAGMHEDLQSFFHENQEQEDLAFLIRILMPLLLAPLFEEVIFRGYMLDKVVRIFRGRARPRAPFDPAAVAGIVFTSALWAAQHGGMLQPEWIKWVQIFGMGAVLGVARIRLGLEVCIALHLIHNLTAGLLVPDALKAEAALFLTLF